MGKPEKPTSWMDRPVQPTAAEQDGIRDVLEGLREALPQLDDDLSRSDAAAVVGQAWDALASALRGSGPASEQQGDLLVRALAQLRQVDTMIVEAKVRDREQGTRRLAGVLEKLEAASVSIQEVVAVAPQLICELGFQRAIISQVANSLWLPEAIFVVNDPAWAAEIAEAGRETPQELHPGLFETDIARKREALIVTGVQQAGARVHRGLAEASRTRSYVAAPILSQGNVVGFVHADRYDQPRDVDEFDRDVLVAFAQALRLALSRASLAERLVSSQRSLSAVSQALAEAAEGLHDAPVTSSPFAHLGAETSTAPRRRADPSVLPTSLTRREIEVLRSMASGRTNSAIALELVISESTAKVHVKNILRKLGAGNRAEAISMWFQAGSGTSQ